MGSLQVTPPPSYTCTDPFSDLPSYTPSVSKSGRLLFKLECTQPYLPAWFSRWHRVEAELCGTKLVLWYAAASNSTKQQSRSYSLQAADTGLANEIDTRPDTLRVRAEGQQFLLVASGIESAIAWVEALHTATLISDPLEDRRMPKYGKIPSGHTYVGSRDQTKKHSMILRPWQVRRGRDWLLGVPEISELHKCAEDAHTAGVRRHHSLSTNAKEPERNLSGCQCPCSTCQQSRARHAIDERKVRQKVNEAIAAENEIARRSVAILRKESEWKYGYYIRNRRKVRIVDPRLTVT